MLGGKLDRSTEIDTDGNSLVIKGDTPGVFTVDGSTNNVGIGTNSPDNKLHVNGSLQIAGTLNVGANDKGNPGERGQYLVSTGPDTVPEWKNGSPNGTEPIPIGATTLRESIKSSHKSAVLIILIF